MDSNTNASTCIHYCNYLHSSTSLITVGSLMLNITAGVLNEIVAQAALLTSASAGVANLPAHSTGPSSFAHFSYWLRTSQKRGPYKLVEPTV